MYGTEPGRARISTGSSNGRTRTGPRRGICGAGAGAGRKKKLLEEGNGAGEGVGQMQVHGRGPGVFVLNPLPHHATHHKPLIHF